MYAAAISTLLIVLPLPIAASPQPGDVYREFPFAMGGALTWRVTDPSASHPGAKAFLPNPVLRFAVEGLDGATRAEIEIDRWGGHAGTTGKKLRVNGHDWIALPQTVSPCIYSQDSPVVEIPLAQLREGENTLEGTSGDQQCHGFGWGQWGGYGGVVRVYYGRSKPHATGSIVSPRAGSSFREDPAIRVEVRGEGTRVDVLASYDGYDEESDGRFDGWHHARRAADLATHAGSAFRAPWVMRWQTSWVPDQPPASVKLIARIRDRAGYWFVTPVVDRLTLARDKVSVKLLRPEAVPERYGVRAGRRMSSLVTLSESPIGWTQAAVILPAWNGYGEKFRVNEWQGDIGGTNHNYALTMIDVPVSALRQGENRIEFHADTIHHGVEVLWPGPAVLLRRGPAAATPALEGWLNGDYDGRIPLHVSVARIASARLQLPREADARTLRVVNYSDRSLKWIKDAAVPWQLEGDELIFQARGGRHFAVYFAANGRAVPPVPVSKLVSVDEGVYHQGQLSFRIRSIEAQWIYHAEGAGFASLFDRDGNDWISYRPGNRAAGEFRGIPNLGAFAHPGYTGERGSQTIIERCGPLTVRLRSLSNDGQGALVWDVYPGFARLTVEKAGAPFWFLYEGTPGGSLDLASGYWGTADGERRSLEETWNQDLPGLEWVYFGDRKVNRALFLINHQNDQANDQFYQMEANMTVWGFGRQHRCCGKYLTAPARFTVGFAVVARNEPIRFDDINGQVQAVIPEAKVEIGKVEWKRKP